MFYNIKLKIGDYEISENHITEITIKETTGEQYTSTTIKISNDITNIIADNIKKRIELSFFHDNIKFRTYNYRVTMYETEKKGGFKLNLIPEYVWLMMSNNKAVIYEGLDTLTMMERLLILNSGESNVHDNLKKMKNSELYSNFLIPSHKTHFETIINLHRNYIPLSIYNCLFFGLDGMVFIAPTNSKKSVVKLKSDILVKKVVKFLVEKVSKLSTVIFKDKKKNFNFTVTPQNNIGEKTHNTVTNVFSEPLFTSKNLKTLYLKSEREYRTKYVNEKIYTIGISDPFEINLGDKIDNTNNIDNCVVGKEISFTKRNTNEFLTQSSNNGRKLFSPKTYIKVMSQVR
jgi:hypothetical protein